MSIANELSRLLQAKSDLATSIAAKGVTVPAATTIDGYATLVDQIQTGGSSLPYDAQLNYLGVRQGVWTELSDYVPTGNGISIDFVATFIGYPTTSNYAIWFAARTGSSYLSYRFIRNTADNKFTINCANTDANSTVMTLNISANHRLHIHLNNVGCDVAWYNNTTVYNAVNTNHSGTANTSGFQIGDHGVARGTELNVHSFTVRNYGTVVLDYIPVRVGQVGYFYDRVRNKLYGKNANSTTDFVLGSDVT